MKAVLIEREINATKMKADQMQEMLRNMHDFKYETTQVEKLLGYLIPKFHYKLNPIECVWAQYKRYTREQCDHSSRVLNQQ